MPIVSKIEIIRLSEVPEDDIASYDSYRANYSELDSPYFHGAFIRSVKHLIPNSFLARFQTNSRTVGYFPFQKRGAVLQPLGAPLSDYHGAVMEKGYFPNWLMLLEAAGAKRFEFSGLVGPGSFGATFIPKPRQISDTSAGFTQWLATHKAADNKYFKNLGRCRRNVEKDLGDVQFFWSSPTEQEIDWVLNHKIVQYERSGFHNIFKCGWTRDMLSALATAGNPDFGLRVGLLRRGDEILAGEICMIDSGTVHFWFPAYDPHYARYSLGLLLTYDIIEKLSEQGVTIFDFGNGGEAYKSAMTSDGSTCFEGSVVRSFKLPFLTGRVGHLLINIGRRIQTIRACETGWQGKIRGALTLTKRAIVRWKH